MHLESQLPDTMYDPLGEASRAQTLASCPNSCRGSLSTFSASRMSMIRSVPAYMTRLWGVPSSLFLGRTATELKYCLGLEAIVVGWKPVGVPGVLFQKRTVPSREPDAMMSGVGKATARTCKGHGQMGEMQLRGGEKHTSFS